MTAKPRSSYCRSGLHENCGGYGTQYGSVVRCACACHDQRGRPLADTYEPLLRARKVISV